VCYYTLHNLDPNPITKISTRIKTVTKKTKTPKAKFLKYNNKSTTQQKNRCYRNCDLSFARPTSVDNID